MNLISIKWSKMALGTPGLLLGWTSFLKNKVRKEYEKLGIKQIKRRHIMVIRLQENDIYVREENRNDVEAIDNINTLAFNRAAEKELIRKLREMGRHM